MGIIAVALICSAFVATYILRAVGVKRILEAVGYERPKQSFVPFASVYALGYAAGMYDDGKPFKGYDKPLLQSYIIAFMVPGAVMGMLLIAGAIGSIGVYALAFLGEFGGQDVSDDAVKLTWKLLFPAMILSAVMISALVPYIVRRAVVLLRVYQIFVPKTAKLLMIISVIIPPAAAIIFFAIRNRKSNNLRIDCKDADGV